MYFENLGEKSATRVAESEEYVSERCLGNQQDDIDYDDLYDDDTLNERDDGSLLTDITTAYGKTLGVDVELPEFFESEMEESFDDGEDELLEEIERDQDDESLLASEMPELYEFLMDDRDWKKEVKRVLYIQEGRKERARRHRSGFKLNEKRIIAKVRADGARRGYGRYVNDGKKSFSSFYFFNVNGKAFQKAKTETRFLRASKAVHRFEDKFRNELSEELCNFEEKRKEQDCLGEGKQGKSTENSYDNSPCWLGSSIDGRVFITPTDFVANFGITQSEFIKNWKAGLFIYDPMNFVLSFRYDEANKSFSKYEGKLFTCYGIDVKGI